MASLRDVLPAPRHSVPDATAASSDIPENGVREGSSDGQAASRALSAERADGEEVTSSEVLPRDEAGLPNFHALAHAGENATRIVHSSPDALVEKPRHGYNLEMPSQEEIDETTRRTRAALEPLVAGKEAAAKTKNFRGAEAKRNAEFVRYTAASTNTSDGTASQQRVIKMMQAPIDPMEPPRFALKKTPARPPSPPVPVLHSPERKPTREEVADWAVPPAISNWKNNRGYTVPLDKRLAASNVGGEEQKINDRFATLAEAMYQAERSAREQVEQRAQMQRNVSLRAKEEKEKELRELAARARAERAGLLQSSVTESEVAEPIGRDPRKDEHADSPLPSEFATRIADDPPPQAPNAVAKEPLSGHNATSLRHAPKRTRATRFGDALVDASTPSAHRPPTPSSAAEDNISVQRRDEIREDRRRERDRELRRREVHGEDATRPTLKRSKLSRDRDRDLSERVALGQGAGGKGGGGANEVMYDQRLFNQDSSSRGIRSGFGADDADTLYDRPLWGDSATRSNWQYRPQHGKGALGEDGNDTTNGDLPPSARFRPNKPLGGADSDKSTHPRSDTRTRPVEFERDNGAKAAQPDDSDPFGFDTFLPKISRSKKA